MATLTLKNIPDELYHRLKSSAALHRRSINSEVIVCLERVLTSRRVDQKSFLTSVRVLREKLSGVFLTDQELAEAKNEGRL